MQIKNILIAAVAASVASGHAVRKNVITTELRVVEQRAPAPEPLTISPPSFGDPLSIISSAITLPPSIFSERMNHTSTAMESASSSSAMASASSSSSMSMVTASSSSSSSSSGSMMPSPSTTTTTTGNAAAGKLSGLSTWSVVLAAGMSALALL